MQYIFAAICLAVVLAAMIFVKSLELGVGLTATLVLPLVLLAIYSIARISPDESKTPKR